MQGVHVRISAQLGLDRFRMCAMTANPSNNCVNLYGLKSFNSRNLTESSLKALFSAARETSLTRFLAVPGVPVHTTVLGGCAHLVRVPRCQRRHRGGARSAPRREIEFSNSRVK